MGTSMFIIWLLLTFAALAVVYNVAHWAYTSLPKGWGYAAILVGLLGAYGVWSLADAIRSRAGRKTTLPFVLYAPDSLAWFAVGVLAMVILVVVVIQRPDADENRRNYEHERWLETPDGRLSQLAQRYSIPQCEDQTSSWRGYPIVDSDVPGVSSRLWESGKNVSLGDLRDGYRMYGIPGVGLESSNFGRGRIKSGEEGEIALAKTVGLVPNVISFWSLYGLDENLHDVDADIDGIVVGLGLDDRLHVWFVDAKNYKGGSDTVYTSITEGELLRLSVAQHAFVRGVNGRPEMPMSENMGRQRPLWNDLMRRELGYIMWKADVQWRVCLTGGSHGSPQVDDLLWPGKVPAVNDEQLIDEIAACGPYKDISQIPIELITFLRGRLKPELPQGYTNPVPLPEVPMAM
ncbi:hypothetical protein [Bifidobacterium catulorum]|uniref:Uncharacterized protein n=1 Tax=Bifidobacterium catulorum TaxID=1630173 RepID=A0A2U2MQF3_9BIFI|nr:hypothetical protein [Bifidobacterium catulorum]PWG59086.1 hypothetical protein DF200_09480 [Bifidobacterium catulorum]